MSFKGTTEEHICQPAACLPVQSLKACRAWSAIGIIVLPLLIPFGLRIFPTPLIEVAIARDIYKRDVGITVIGTPKLVYKNPKFFLINAIGIIWFTRRQQQYGPFFQNPG